MDCNLIHFLLVPLSVLRLHYIFHGIYVLLLNCTCILLFFGERWSIFQHSSAMFITRSEILDLFIIVIYIYCLILLRGIYQKVNVHKIYIHQKENTENIKYCDFSSFKVFRIIAKYLQLLKPLSESQYAIKKCSVRRSNNLEKNLWKKRDHQWYLPPSKKMKLCELLY